MKESGQFVKRCGSQERAQAEFERAQWVYRRLQESPASCLRVARPLDCRGREVYFERISNCLSLRQLVCRLRVDTNTLTRVGRALAEFHQALNPGLDDLNQELEIHGDFWPENILCDTGSETIWVVDFSPPCFDSDIHRQQGVVYEDLAPMIIMLEIKYPLSHIYLLMRRSNPRLTECFLAGYEEAMGIGLDRAMLDQSLCKWLRSYSRSFRRKNILSRFVWTRRFRYYLKTYTLRSGLS